MTSIIYYDKVQENRHPELEEYIQSESYQYAKAVITTFLQAFVQDGYAIAEDENNFYIKSPKTGGTVGFFFEFNKETKEIASVVLTINGTEYEYLTIMDLSTLSTNEDIIFPICLALDVS